MTFLLVDDDPEIRLMAGFLLRQAGHDVIEATDGAAALAACSAGVPDAILMDVLLGEEDGVEVAERLRAHCSPPPPVIFLTGAVRSDQLARLEAARPAGVIAKPFDPSSFSAAVVGHLERA